MRSRDAVFEQLDTTAEAERAQVEAYRRLGGAERLAIAFRLGAFTRATALAGIRSRHPDYSEAEQQLALRTLMFGAELVQAAWPGARLVEP